MKFRKLLLAWLVASTTLMLYSCAEPFPNVQTDREQSRLPNATKCAEAEKTAKYLSKGCPDRNAKNEACWPSLPMRSIVRSAIRVLGLVENGPAFTMR